jgi:hypothetical protein
MDITGILSATPLTTSKRSCRAAREAYVTVSNVLCRLGIRSDEWVSNIPDSIDLAGNSETERTLTKPRNVAADELGRER